MGEQSQAIPMVGRVFGKLTVIEREPTTVKLESCQIRWICLCECGRKVARYGVALRSGESTHCGCSPKPRPRKIKEVIVKPRRDFSLVGKVIGRLDVICKTIDSGILSADTNYECTCSCGGSVVRSHAYLICSKGTASCGCIPKEVAARLSKTFSIDLEGKTFGILKVISRGPRVLKGKRTPKWYTTWTCKCGCGTEINADTSKLAAGRIVSCGCLSSKETKKLTSNYRYRYRKGDDGRKSDEYSAWRTSVFTRDAWCCVKCGGKSGGINAHHLEDYESNPELRLEVSNGVTLCVTCHKAFHNTYGWAGRTYSWQFEEFILV